jgi:hypothetical protein
VIAAHLSDLGGVDNSSAAERSLIRRAAVLTTELEMLEARFAAAGQASSEDLDLYQRTAGNLRRLLEAIGLQRRARNITPSVSEYLTARNGATPAHSNGTNGAALDLKVEQTNGAVIDDPVDTATT